MDDTVRDDLLEAFELVDQHTTDVGEKEGEYLSYASGIIRGIAYDADDDGTDHKIEEQLE